MDHYCDVQIKDEPVEDEDFGIFHSEIMIKTENEQNEKLMNFENGSLEHFMKQEDTHFSDTDRSEQQHGSVDFPRTSDANFNQGDSHFILENNSEESQVYLQDRVFVPGIKYQGVLKCTLCQGIYFLNIQNLIEHGLDFHNVCFKCDRVSTEDHKNCCETIDNFDILLNCDQNNAKTRIIYECPTCRSMNFASSHNLQNHLISVHGLKACPQCNAILASGHPFRKHTIGHNRRIPSKRSLEEKLISQPPQPHFEKKELQKHECNMCPDVFPNSLKLKHHLSSTHDFKLCTFPKCEKLFVTSVELKNHSRKCHPTKNRVLNHEELKNGSLKCKLCLLPFKTGLNLARHVNTEHAKCQICSLYFISKAHLAEHYTTDHPLNACLMLSKKDIIKFRKKHVIKSDGHNFSQFYCEICSKIIHSSKKKHHKQVHKKSTKKFKCYQCMDLMPFKTYRSLRRHRRERHPKYICDFCNRIFNDGKIAFENHVKTHVPTHSE